MTMTNDEFAEMIFYNLEDVYFQMVIGDEREYVHALSSCEYKGTEPLTMDQEHHLMTKQVNETKGFDMDFSQFRYAFNYKPVDFDDNELAMDGETIRELMDRLSCKILELYNDGKATSYEFLEVSKASYHMAGAGVMFFITFHAKADDDEPKTFQAKLIHSIESLKTADNEDAKVDRGDSGCKQALMRSLSLVLVLLLLFYLVRYLFSETPWIVVQTLVSVCFAKIILLKCVH